jgi:phage head maturation protease
LIQPATLNEENREVEVVFATETPVFRFGWEEDYNEVLVCEESAMRMERANRGLPVLDTHNNWELSAQLGRTVKVWVDKERRECRATIRFSQREQVKSLFQDVKDGIITDISVGYRVHSFEKTASDSKNTLPVYRAVDWEPTEISFVPCPADPNSGVRTGANKDNNEVKIIYVKSYNSNRKMAKKTRTKKRMDYEVVDNPVNEGDEITIDDVVYIAQEDGEVGDTIQVEPKEDENRVDYEVVDSPVNEGDEITIDGVVYIAKEDGEVGDTIQVELKEARRLAPKRRSAEVAKIRAAATKQERTRLDAILVSVRAAKLEDSYAIELYKSNKPIEQCRQEILEKVIAKQPVIDGRHSASAGMEAIEKKRAAMQEAILHRVYPSAFKLKDGKNEYRGMTLVEMGKELLVERGFSVRGMDRMQVGKHVFSRAQSTGDFAVLFEDVINGLLRADYGYKEETWPKIAKQSNTIDFRAKKLYKVDKAGGMMEVPEGSELKYTTLVESKEELRIKKFGQGIRFTFEAFINDSLGALSIIPSVFVRDWDKKRGDIVWSVIIDNKAMIGDTKNFFHADHKNMITGAASSLSKDSLSQARVKFRRQTDAAGNILQIEPKFLIVPPELETTAQRLMVQTIPTVDSDVNVFAGTLQVLVENRLSDTDAWYLAADPGVIDGIYYGYIEGNENLRVNELQNYKVDAIEYSVFGEFGAAGIDYRGWIKSNGKA